MRRLVRLLEKDARERASIGCTGIWATTAMSDSGMRWRRIRAIVASRLASIDEARGDGGAVGEGGGAAVSVRVVIEEIVRARVVETLGVTEGAREFSR